MDKITVKQVLLTFVGGIFLIVVYCYWFYPGPIMTAFNDINASLAKLEKKSIIIDGYTLHYYEGPFSKERETLVLLHGLGDDKNSFVSSAKNLSNEYHIILPDLLGHGENEKTAGLDYSVEGQAAMMRKFLQAKELAKVHLGGHSMGGHIAAAYAVRYQDTLKSLIIINSPGLNVDDHIAYNSFEDRVISEEELEPLMAKVFYKVPKLPKPLRVCKVQQMNADHDFIKYIVIPQMMNNKDFDLINKVSGIYIPSLILWGKYDEVVKYNVAEKYHELLPHAKLVVIDHAAHCPQLETPGQVSAEINIFIKGIKPNL